MIRFALGDAGSSRSSAATASPIASSFVAPRSVLPEDLPAFLDDLRIMLYPRAATAPILTSGLPRVKSRGGAVVEHGGACESAGPILIAGPSRQRTRFRLTNAPATALQRARSSPVALAVAAMVGVLFPSSDRAATSGLSPASRFSARPIKRRASMAVPRRPAPSSSREGRGWSSGRAKPPAAKIFLLVGPTTVTLMAALHLRLGWAGPGRDDSATGGTTAVLHKCVSMSLMSSISTISRSRLGIPYTCKPQKPPSVS